MYEPTRIFFLMHFAPKDRPLCVLKVAIRDLMSLQRRRTIICVAIALTLFLLIWTVTDDERSRARPSVVSLTETYRATHAELHIPQGHERRPVSQHNRAAATPHSQIEEEADHANGLQPTAHRDEEATATTAALQLDAQTYCRITNPDPSSTRSCLTAVHGFRRAVTQEEDDQYVVVVTVAESELWPDASASTCDLSRLAWLEFLQIPTVIVVKSKKTPSFRQNNLSWTLANDVAARQLESMYAAVNPAFDSDLSLHDGSKRTTPGRELPVFRSVLRDMWQRAELGGAADEGESKKKALPSACRGAEWLRRKLDRGPPQELLIFESPNVGDEALTVVEIALRLTMAMAPSTADAREKTAHEVALDDEATLRLGTLDGLLSRARHFVFLHSHAESWHAVDAIQQLQCFCMDRSVERYRTLTSPSKAFLLQCMPLVTNESEVLLNVLAAAPIAAASNPDFVAFQRRTISQQSALSRMFRTAYRKLASLTRAPVSSDGGVVNDNFVPEAVVRDCCATFVVTREAIVHAASHVCPRCKHRAESDEEAAAHSTRFFRQVRRSILMQPSEVSQYFGDEVAAAGGGEPGERLRVGELSMVLERFWRTIFGANEYDTQRDLLLRDCSAVGRASNKAALHLDCPPQWNIQGKEGLLAPLKKRVARGTVDDVGACDDDFAKRNAFRP